MKRIRTLQTLFILFIALFLAACGGSADENGNGTSSIVDTNIVLVADQNTGIVTPRYDGHLRLVVMDEGENTDGEDEVAINILGQNVIVNLHEANGQLSGILADNGLPALPINLVDLSLTDSDRERLENAGVKSLAIYRRATADGDMISLMLNNTMLAQVNVDAAEMLVEMAFTLCHDEDGDPDTQDPSCLLPQSMEGIAKTLVETVANSDMSLDLAYVFTGFDENTDAINWPAVTERVIVSEDGEETTVAIPGAGETIQVTVPAGHGAWGATDRWADTNSVERQSAMWWAVYDALEAHRTSGGTWRAGDTVEVTIEGETAEAEVEAPVIETVVVEAPVIETDTCSGLDPLIAADGTEWSGTYGDEAAVNAAASMALGRMPAGTYEICLDAAIWPNGAHFYDNGSGAVAVAAGESQTITLGAESGIAN
jgi:hypothetical protein